MMISLRVCDECGVEVKENNSHYLPIGEVVINGEYAGQSSDLCDIHYDPITKMPKNCKKVEWIFPGSKPPTLEDIVIELTKNQAVKEVKLNSDFIKDLEMNNSDIICICCDLEDFYEMDDTPDETVDNFKTPQDIVNYLKTKGIK